jgi:superkiller protein 3
VALGSSISTNPEDLTAINVLAAMGILTDDDSLIDAALSEILSLSVDRRLELDPQRNVDHLLVQHHLDQVRCFRGPTISTTNE